MGATKYGSYTDKQERIAKIAKALAHPARITILQLLAEQQHCQCGELSEEIELAQSTISQHLKELKNAGLIQGVIESSKPCYCLSAEGISVVIDFLNFIKSASVADNSCC